MNTDQPARLIPHINCTADMERANRRAGFYFFSPDTMRFFNSRVDNVIFKAADGLKIYFCTSEKAPHDKRRYSVRVFDVATSDIDTFGEFQGYRTLAQAFKAAEAAATASTTTQGELLP